MLVFLKAVKEIGDRVLNLSLVLRADVLHIEYYSRWVNYIQLSNRMPPKSH